VADRSEGDDTKIEQDAGGGLEFRTTYRLQTPVEMPARNYCRAMPVRIKPVEIR
jgi:hypothetical protein